MTSCTVDFQNPSDPRKLLTARFDTRTGTFGEPSPVEITVMGGNAANFRLADYVIPLSRVNAAALTGVMEAQAKRLKTVYGEYAWSGVRLSGPDAFSRTPYASARPRRPPRRQRHQGLRLCVGVARRQANHRQPSHAVSAGPDRTQPRRAYRLELVPAQSGGLPYRIVELPTEQLRHHSFVMLMPRSCTASGVGLQCPTAIARQRFLQRNGR